MRRNNNILVLIILFLVLSVGIGYGYLSSELNIIGDVLIRKYDPPRYLYDEIIAQNKENGVRVLDNQASTYVTATTGIDFDVAPSDTNGKSVYIRNGTENDTNPVYYYRGAVTNNNVIFGGYCWKMVRTTETGGIKLIYNGVPTEGSCNNTGEASQIGTSAFNSNSKSNAYVGYMHGTPNSSTYDAEHLSTKESTSSTIKTYIDTWYSENMTSYTSYLEDTIWCNDRSIVPDPFYGTIGTGAGQSETFYGAVERNYSTSSPSLECVNQNDRFTVEEIMEGRVNGNGALTYPVALLTADELTIAGQGYNGYSTTNYLHTGQYWWSMSPDSYSSAFAFDFIVDSGGYLSSSGRVNYSYYGVRPSVSLRPGTQITEDGDGSVNSPFVVDCGEKTITIIGNDDITTNNYMDKAIAGKTVTLSSISGDNKVNSFKMNGTLIEGTSFTMPEEDVIITDINVTTKGTITVEQPESGESYGALYEASPSKAFAGTTISLYHANGSNTITSFEMNGQLIEGTSFTMPEGDVIITNIYVIHEGGSND